MILARGIKFANVAPVQCWGLAAGEVGHGPSLLRQACVRGALQDSRLLNNARKIRNRLFVDGRRLRPDDPRQILTGQDGQEAGCHTPSKRTQHR